MTQQRPETGSLSTADLADPDPVAINRDTGTEAQQAQQAQTEEPAVPGTTTTGAEPTVTLLEDSDQEAFQQRWSDVQSRFVDDPRGAVGDADALVAELMRSLAQGFAEHKSSLEEQWSHGGEDDTEQLRVALRRYRFFFSRLLAT
jgi:hypothetical protein